MDITTAQIRGARGILNWSQADLAERTGISATSIGSIENGLTKPRANTLHTIKLAFENSGIEFLSGEGVRLKTGEVKIYKGRSGYLDFFDVVYEELSNHGGEALVSNVDERDFAKWHGDVADDYLRRISSIPSLKYKILTREGDTYFPANKYSEYKWLPKNAFASVPFYVFGKKLAIMLFDNEPTIILLEYPAIAEAYKIQFNAMWEQAMEPDYSIDENKQKVA
jgi:transcriptional regulator with XRE-family HTH domain